MKLRKFGDIPIYKKGNKIQFCKPGDLFNINIFKGGTSEIRNDGNPYLNSKQRMKSISNSEESQIKTIYGTDGGFLRYASKIIRGYDPDGKIWYKYVPSHYPLVDEADPIYENEDPESFKRLEQYFNQANLLIK